MFKMTPNIMRNLVVKKSTRMYPAEVRQTFDKPEASSSTTSRAASLRHLRRQVPFPVHCGGQKGLHLDL